MSKCEDLLEKARRVPQGLRLQEALDLAECWGFRHRRSRRGTSHRIYKRPGFIQMLNFQPDSNGNAKRKQVDQLLSAIDALIDHGETAE
jgi:hypothetical protein